MSLERLKPIHPRETPWKGCPQFNFFLAWLCLTMLIPCVWVEWLFGACLIHLRKFRISLDSAISSLVSLWSCLCSGQVGGSQKSHFQLISSCKYHSHTVQAWKYFQDSIAFYSSSYPQLFQTAAASEGEMGTKSHSCQEGFSALCQQGEMGGDACGGRQ